MRLFAIFLILNIQLSLIFASPPNLLPSSSGTYHAPEGYECGNSFFSNDEVKEALLLGLISMGLGYRFPEKYKGKLYSGSGSEEYFLYPLRNGKQIKPQTTHINTVYFIVFTRKDEKLEDVVAITTTRDYTKCVRKYRTHEGLLHLVPENTNGYLCDHTFFSDEIVLQCRINALAIVGGHNKYPLPYLGSLYPKNGGYLLWPMMNHNVLYKSGTDKLRPYFLILNNQREVVDVVVRGFKGNYLRCLRIRKHPTAPESDPLSKLFVKPPTSGYVCGKYFIDDKILGENAEIVKDKVEKAIQNNLLETNFGTAFNERCIIWPISREGRLFSRGHKGIFRLILTLDYKVKGVAMLINDKLKPCERDTIEAEKNHDPSAYQCQERFLSHEVLVAAAEEACVKMNTAKYNTYPARCEGKRFKLDGPYFAYPVYGTSAAGKHNTNPGIYRVLINTNCEVVGALSTFPSLNNQSLPNKKQKKYMRCHRIVDGPLPLEFFGANAEIVNC